jgi:uncharacterized radical SAM superfamily protein
VFLLALMLSYTLAALVVALAIPWIGTVFMPCFLVATAAVVVVLSTRRKAFGSVVRDAEKGSGHCEMATP